MKVIRNAYLNQEVCPLYTIQISLPRGFPSILRIICCFLWISINYTNHTLIEILFSIPSRFTPYTLNSNLKKKRPLPLRASVLMPKDSIKLANFFPSKAAWDSGCHNGKLASQNLFTSFEPQLWDNFFIAMFSIPQFWGQSIFLRQNQKFHKLLNPPIMVKFILYNAGQFDCISET